MINRKAYLGIPYTGKEESSFKVANVAAGMLMKEGWIVYSPISQNHPIAKAVQLPTEWEYWERIDKEFLKWADVLIVLCIPEWRKSIGLAAEIQIAEELKKEIIYMNMDGYKKFVAGV